MLARLCRTTPSELSSWRWLGGKERGSERAEREEGKPCLNLPIFCPLNSKLLWVWVETNLAKFRKKMGSSPRARVSFMTCQPLQMPVSYAFELVQMSSLSMVATRGSVFLSLVFRGIPFQILVIQTHLSLEDCPDAGPIAVRWLLRIALCLGSYVVRLCCGSGYVV